MVRGGEITKIYEIFAKIYEAALQEFTRFAKKCSNRINAELLHISLYKPHRYIGLYEAYPISYPRSKGSQISSPFWTKMSVSDEGSLIY